MLTRFYDRLENSHVQMRLLPYLKGSDNCLKSDNRQEIGSFSSRLGKDRTELRLDQNRGRTGAQNYLAPVLRKRQDGT